MKTITFNEFKKVEAKEPYYKNRWEYYSKIIGIIKKEAPKSVLELGPKKLPLVKDSDTMDKALILPQLTYHHDATKFPWPIEDKKYDLFIALQVWEHLGGKQRQAFKEVMRISKAAILSFPYKRRFWPLRKQAWRLIKRLKKFRTRTKHINIDEKKISKWTLHIKPEQIIKIKQANKEDKIIYFFRF